MHENVEQRRLFRGRFNATKMLRLLFKYKGLLSHSYEVGTDNLKAMQLRSATGQLQ